MRRKCSIRDFGAGAVVGLVIGTSGLATAALTITGWQKLSTDFKIGYVTGYLDMAGIARNLEPGGYVDERYPRAHAKPVEWAALIDKLYKDPEYKSYSINSMMQAAAHQLADKRGATSAEERMQSQMARQLAAIKKRQDAQASKEGKEPPKIVDAPMKKVAAPPKPKSRKWCRCDGKDPKVERAKRRAARAEAEKAAATQAEREPAAKPDAAGSDAGKPDTTKSPPAPAKP